MRAGGGCLIGGCGWRLSGVERRRQKNMEAAAAAIRNNNKDFYVVKCLPRPARLVRIGSSLLQEVASSCPRALSVPRCAVGEVHFTVENRAHVENFHPGAWRNAATFVLVCRHRSGDATTRTKNARTTLRFHSHLSHAPSLSGSLRSALVEGGARRRCARAGLPR
jgi:hypothetical protein